METEMVEPDRTIMIVSIIGLVVIWGSFFYHKFVQGGSGGVQGGDEAASPLQAPVEAITAEEPIAEAQTGDNKRKAKKKKKR